MFSSSEASGLVSFGCRREIGEMTLAFDARSAALLHRGSRSTDSIKCERAKTAQCQNKDINRERLSVSLTNVHKDLQLRARPRIA